LFEKKLFFFYEIIEKIGMKNELWPVLKSHFADVVIPHHRTFTLQHIQQEENATSDVQFNGNGNKDSMIEVIEEVLTKVTEDPQSVSKIPVHHKCKLHACNPNRTT
jgi:hypothetical protein